MGTSWSRVWLIAVDTEFSSFNYYRLYYRLEQRSVKDLKLFCWALTADSKQLWWIILLIRNCPENTQLDPVSKGQKVTLMVNVSLKKSHLRFIWFLSSPCPKNYDLRCPSNAMVDQGSRVIQHAKQSSHELLRPRFCIRNTSEESWVVLCQCQFITCLKLRQNSILDELSMIRCYY